MYSSHFFTEISLLKIEQVSNHVCPNTTENMQLHRQNQIMNENTYQERPKTQIQVKFMIQYPM